MCIEVTPAGTPSCNVEVGKGVPSAFASSSLQLGVDTATGYLELWAGTQSLLEDRARTVFLRNPSQC
jgi:hypothetical protein